MRTHSMPRPRRALRALVALIGLVLAVPTMIAASPTSATAASTTIGSRSVANYVARAAWNPRVIPLYSNETRLTLDFAGYRERFLDVCQTSDFNGYACIVVGDGDGWHTGFAMTRCGWRKVYDFINAGTVVNNQYRDARVRLYNASQTEIASYGNGMTDIPDVILYATEWISVC